MEDWDGENDVCSIGGEVILSDLGAFTFIEEVAKKLDELYEIRILRIMNS